MHRPTPKRHPFLLAAALVVGTLVVPSGVGAADAAQAIIDAAPAGGPTVDLLVGARTGRSAGVAELAARFGTRDQGSVRGLAVHRLRVPAAAAAALERTLGMDPSVGYVELDATAHAALVPDDPQYAGGGEWGLPLIGAPAAWDTSTGAGGPIIAVIDTGVDATHPDLGGRVLAGYDFINHDGDASDDNGHGTHVAGIIAATGNNAIGGAGVCWGCRILPVKALDAGGGGSYSTLAAAITWATDHGARIISMSLSGDSSSRTLGDAVVYAQGRGIVVVAAAGNAGSTIRRYPAAFPDVVAVAASTESGTLIGFSNRGADWVDVAAGACSVSTARGGGYVNMCGTSMATPFVAGSLGLLLAADPGATASEALAAIDATAGPEITDATTYGLVHLDAALAALIGSPTPSPSPSPTPTPTPTTPPSPSPSPNIAPAPAAPSLVTRTASLSRVPKAFVVLAHAADARLSIANPRRAYLVLTVKRAGRVIWRRKTRARAIHWTLYLGTSAYTVTVSRPGSRAATGRVSLRYRPR
ncbi:MAG TPA: S8 family serine peptidase [Candidatus Limnocylindrales bacterium]|nr:S8 family serine peptidase [Candidatus Limnocylindrales bacterium]